MIISQHKELEVVCFHERAVFMICVHKVAICGKIMYNLSQYAIEFALIIPAEKLIVEHN